MENSGGKMISAAEFLELDRRGITIVDVREPDEVLIHGISGAINVPFSTFPEGLDEVPRDKPVYVICWFGENSEKVTDALTEQGYDACNVEGGYLGLRSLDEHFGEASDDEDEYDEDEEDEDEAEVAEVSEINEGTSGDGIAHEDPDPVKPVEIDARGMKCPGPIVKVADSLKVVPEGGSIHVLATEEAFASDIGIWCEKTGNILKELRVTPELIEATIEKGAAGKASPEKNTSADIPHGKNFVVFSGDLDKTIAAFIMANGSAAMGRQVTMFFTFWGLNILRKPYRVRVKKPFIEKMFSTVMPRGTYKLGLSRMNMLGIGPKMIRGIMKKKEILTLEELMQNAMDHGVRIIACQMSMDIMGITREELIDGVELGGVSSFLGSAEESDMSLFI